MQVISIKSLEVPPPLPSPGPGGGGTVQTAGSSGGGGGGSNSNSAMLVGIIAALGVCAALASLVAVVLYRRGKRRRAGNDYSNNPIYGANGARVGCRVLHFTFP